MKLHVWLLLLKEIRISFFKKEFHDLRVSSEMPEQDGLKNSLSVFFSDQTLCLCSLNYPIRHMPLVILIILCT